MSAITPGGTLAHQSVGRRDAYLGYSRDEHDPVALWIVRKFRGQAEHEPLAPA